MKRSEENENLNGDFLTLAPPSPISYPPSMSKSSPTFLAFHNQVCPESEYLSLHVGKLRSHFSHFGIFIIGLITLIPIVVLSLSLTPYTYKPFSLVAIQTLIVPFC